LHWDRELFVCLGGQQTVRRETVSHLESPDGINHWIVVQRIGSILNSGEIASPGQYRS
jgi:hypothetical protein